jgi:tRNA pseudouridine55 synthase
MIDGILLINKQAGITSYDVIRKLKKILPQEQKIGHGGTLDPFATGLLIILLGKYTKKMVEILEMEKEYIAKAQFGYATDTQDITGKKIKGISDLKSVKQTEIEKLIKEHFVGEISQTPPQFSAKKIKGKKAYELAREGKEVKLQPKVVTVKNFEIIDYDWPSVIFRIICSSGTYVRTLINDLGLLLGTFATAVELERKRSLRV